MKIATVTGNLYEIIYWLELNVGKFISVSNVGDIIGEGWKLQFVHNRDTNCINEEVRVNIKSDILATEFILRYTDE